MKRKILILTGLILLAAGVYRFREPLKVRLFPKIILSRAIDDACRQLEERYRDSPLFLLSRALDEQGRQRIHMTLEFKSRSLGPAHLDLNLDTQTGPNRIAGEGIISSESGLLDLKLQLDETSASLSSESLTDGIRYGITYSSFSGDIRQFELIELLLGQDTLESWEKSVDRLGEIIGCDYEIPRFDPQGMRTALLGVLVLKPQVAFREDRESCSIGFAIAGKDLAEKAQACLDRIPDELYDFMAALQNNTDSSLQVTYHLRAGSLTGAEALLYLDDATYTLTASLEENLLNIVLNSREGEHIQSRELTILTSPSEGSYRETITYLHREDNSQTRYSADYTWNLSSGDLILNAEKDGAQYPLRLNVKGEGRSAGIICRDISPVLSLLTGKEQKYSAICAITLSPGSSVPPMDDYKNLSAWSLEDLYLLLTRAGSLVGLKMP